MQQGSTLVHVIVVAIWLQAKPQSGGLSDYFGAL